MLVVIPRATEKAYLLSLKNTYIFDVPANFNKNQIKDAVEKQFNVNVIDIKTLISKGKKVRFSRGKGRYPGVTNRKDFKKAYITLKEGDKIDLFESHDQQEANEDKETK